MIDRVRIESYKALRDVDLELTPVHALIGPNDTGKTSILYALAALSLSTTQPPWEGRQLVWHGDTEGIIRLSAEFSLDGQKLQYALASRFGNSGRNVVVEDETVFSGAEKNLGRKGHDRTRVQGVSSNEQAPTKYARLASWYMGRWPASTTIAGILAFSLCQRRRTPSGAFG